MVNMRRERTQHYLVGDQGHDEADEIVQLRCVELVTCCQSSARRRGTGGFGARNEMRLRSVQESVCRSQL